jgi:hypothetical protein
MPILLGGLDDGLGPDLLEKILSTNLNGLKTHCNLRIRRG